MQKREVDRRLENFVFTLHYSLKLLIVLRMLWIGSGQYKIFKYDWNGGISRVGSRNESYSFSVYKVRITRKRAKSVNKLLTESLAVSGFAPNIFCPLKGAIKSCSVKYFAEITDSRKMISINTYWFANTDIQHPSVSVHLTCMRGFFCQIHVFTMRARCTSRLYNSL